MLSKKVKVINKRKDVKKKKGSVKKIKSRKKSNIKQVKLKIKKEIKLSIKKKIKVSDKEKIKRYNELHNIAVNVVNNYNKGNKENMIKCMWCGNVKSYKYEACAKCGIY